MRTLKGTLFNCKLAKLVVGRLPALLISHSEEVAMAVDDDQIDCMETQPEEVDEEPRSSVRKAAGFWPEDEGAKNGEPVV